MQDHYVNGGVSALVILAAVGLTFTTYSAYRDQVSTTELEKATAGMDQAASAMLSYRLERAATAVVSTTTAASAASTTTKAARAKAQ